jgi:hypothetical protein
LQNPVTPTEFAFLIHKVFTTRYSSYRYPVEYFVRSAAFIATKMKAAKSSNIVTDYDLDLLMAVVPKHAIEVEEKEQRLSLLEWFAVLPDKYFVDTSFVMEITYPILRRLAGGVVGVSYEDSFSLPYRGEQEE